MNKTTFNWPAQKSSWDFCLPWHSVGNWFYCRWEFLNANKTSLTLGTRIFGFTKIDRIWLCSEEQAKAEHKRGVDNLLNWLRSELDNAKKSATV